jgi:omega-hydroxy-beta-dihydromenaquinone-9 sulfotransferase
VDFDFASWWLILRRIVAEPFRFRRKLFLYGVFAGLSLVSVGGFLGLALDHVFFPGFRKVEVRRPIFIVGNGRSGTTHMHRLLAGDARRFTWFRTYEMLMPSIVQRKLLWALAALDRRLLGGALARRLRVAEDEAFEDVRGKHNWRLDGPEEDDFLLFNNWSSASLVFPFNYPELIEQLYGDRQSKLSRRRQFRFYRGLIRRQLHLYGAERIHCCKSPSFTMKIRALREYFPDARFILMLRHPAESIPSLVDLMSWYWRGFGSPPELALAAAKALAEANVDNYRSMAELALELPTEQQFVVDYEALCRDPKAVVEAIYARFGLEIEPAYDAFLERERVAAKGFVSGHDYDPEGQGPGRARLHRELAPLYARFGWAP